MADNMFLLWIAKAFWFVKIAILKSTTYTTSSQGTLLVSDAAYRRNLAFHFATFIYTVGCKAEAGKKISVLYLSGGESNQFKMFRTHSIFLQNFDLLTVESIRGVMCRVWGNGYVWNVDKNNPHTISHSPVRNDMIELETHMFYAKYV